MNRTKVILVSLIITLFSCAFIQTEKYSGNYEKKESSDGIVVEYEFSLNTNKSFSFHFYQDQICYSEDKKAKGTWNIINDTITLQMSKENNIDNNSFIDLDKTLVTVKNGILKFHKSKTLWINYVELKKI